MKKLILICLLFTTTASAKELYEIAEIPALSETHQNTRVTVFGMVTEMEHIQGRHGSENTILTIEDENKNALFVSVPFFVIKNMRGREVFVQGKYIINCFVGGIRMLDSCIRMERIGRTQ